MLFRSNLTATATQTITAQFVVSDNEVMTLATHLEVHGWVKIPDAQLANWQAINDAQTPGWTAINDAQSPNWTPIPDEQ